MAAIGEKVKAATSEVLSSGDFPFILGGDHSVSLGSISAATSFFKDRCFGVIYIDAHADMNTPRTSPTGNVHGMCLAATLGKGDGRLVSVADTLLTSDKLLMIGTRSVDPGERELLTDLNVKTITSDEINNRLDGMIGEIEDFIRANKLDCVHLSVDIDVLDPKYAPATGVPELGGISPASLERVLGTILKTGIVKSCDLVEYIPGLDDDRQTLKRCEAIVSQIMQCS